MSYARTATHTFALGLALTLAGSTALAQHRNLAIRTPRRVMMIRSTSPSPSAGSSVTVNATTLAQRAKWTQYLNARRVLMLNELQRFGEAGVFPINTVVRGRANIMIDGDGNLCAVAHLMSTFGDDPMVRSASRANNGMLFANVTSGPIRDWVLRSGFTREEISRIQEPYEYQDPNSRSIKGAVLEQERLMQHFAQLVPELRAHAAESVATAVDRLGDAVMRDPPPIPAVPVSEAN